MFSMFSYLPKELRLQIWIEALPGPRVVYVQRLFVSGETANEVWERGELDSPEPTYWTSATPNESIVPMMYACKESHGVVASQYSQLFPSTWFSFTKDFLYLDWGYGYHSTNFSVENFTASWPEDFLIDRFGQPVLCFDLVKKVKNLVVNKTIKHWVGESLEEWLVQKVLKVFSGVDVLVMADQLHSVSEGDQKLVWLKGEVGQEVDLKLNNDEEDRLSLINLLLWRDITQYTVCADVSQVLLEKEWKKHIPEKSMPLFAKKSITTLNLKNSILDICQLEENFTELVTLNMPFVDREEGHIYQGNLDLAQQIAYLKLVLSRISTTLEFDSYGIRMQGWERDDIIFLLDRVDGLVAELEVSEIPLREAEDMVWSH